MSTLNEIKEAVSRFLPEDFVAFRAWFVELDADEVDLESQGINQAQAQVLQSNLTTFSEDWDSPEMSLYDNYDAAKASVQTR